jgi:hypothetical protein
MNWYRHLDEHLQPGLDLSAACARDLAAEPRHEALRLVGKVQKDETCGRPGR